MSTIAAGLWPVIQSTGMAASRLRRAGILLLVLWVTADMAAFGFCSGDAVSGASTSTVISASDTAGGGPSACTGHHCFCCSSGAEVASFDLAVEGPTVLMKPPSAPNAPDFPPSNTSPPPRA